MKNECIISIHLSDTESYLEDTPTHDRKELPTGARAPLSDAEFDYTHLSNKFLAADDFKGSTQSLPPTILISSHESSPHPAEKENPVTLQQAVEQGSHVHPRPVDFLLTEGAPSSHPEKNTANADEDEASVIHPVPSPATRSPADDKKSLSIHEDDFSINLVPAEEQALATIKQISTEFHTEGNNFVEILKAEQKYLNENSLMKKNSIEPTLPAQLRTEGDSWYKGEQKLPGNFVHINSRFK